MLKHIDQDYLLYVDGVTISFDGFKALNNLSLLVKPGELRAIIGPNGAGKTTMMDVITGKLRPDSGMVTYDNEHDLLHHDEAGVAELGIGRKFQKPSVVESLSVYQNLELALAGKRGVFSLLRPYGPVKQSQIEAILERIALTDRRDTLAGYLSHGQKQWLELGMLLALDPKLLLIDEPAAGMSDEETARTAELFKELAGGHALVVVEHDMDFIQALDCPVTVLHEGSVLAEGSMASVQANEQVVEVYLGR